MYRVEPAVTKTAREEIIKREAPAKVMPGICVMDSDACRIQLTVLVVCTEEMMVSKEDGIHLQKRAVKHGWAVDQKYGTVSYNLVRRMLITQLWHRVEPGHRFIDSCTFHMPVG
jgi:hypothetical protein